MIMRPGQQLLLPANPVFIWFSLFAALVLNMGLNMGLFGRAAQTAQSLQTMAAGPQHDAALDAAVKEISPLFKQCTRCGNWVCEPICWNKKAGLCETCAPDLDEEIAAALGLSLSAVKMRILRARQELRAALEAAHG